MLIFLACFWPVWQTLWTVNRGTQNGVCSEYVTGQGGSGTIQENWQGFTGGWRTSRLRGEAASIRYTPKNGLVIYTGIYIPEAIVRLHSFINCSWFICCGLYICVCVCVYMCICANWIRVWMNAVLRLNPTHHHAPELRLCFTKIGEKKYSHEMINFALRLWMFAFIAHDAFDNFVGVFTVNLWLA